MIISPDIDEKNLKDELPTVCAKRLAMSKALKIQDEQPNSLILTADTIAFCGRRIIDKTEDINIAKKYLELLSGRRHRVVSSIFITNGNKKDHERRHLNLKLFKCQSCKMRFHRSNQLKSHKNNCVAALQERQQLQNLQFND